MILDKLSNYEFYRGLNRQVQVGFDFLLKRGLDELPDGKYPVDGDVIYALIQTYTTEAAERRQYEAHRKYLDIQYLLKGKELLYWNPIENAPEGLEYSDANDAVLFQKEHGTPVPLSSGYFVVLFPQDAHKPGCAWESPAEVRKVVVKIRLPG